MKHVSKWSGKVGKGAPSGFIISVLVHAGAFFLAGIFVVFSVVNKQEPEFQAPPPIARPKMNLKKPKVKVQKSSTPKPSSRIVAKVKTAKMPDIQIPDLVGSGEGLMEGIGLGGDFLELPEVKNVTLMGSTVSGGNDFVGTYYDFNRRSNGGFYSMSTDEYQDIVLQFFLSGWDEADLSRFYRSPTKLYSTCFMVPKIPSDLGPEAFDEAGAAGYCWGILYKGKLVHSSAIRFRFRGFGDDVLMVRVDGELVLAASWPGSSIQEGCGWTSNSGDSETYRLGAQGAVVGDWITLEPGVAKDMEVFIGESPGGQFSAQLVVEVDGVNYKRNSYGGPILPMFTTEVPSWETLDAICPHLVQGEAMLTNGPVFNDYYDDSAALPMKEM